jgi:hypothetical protein
MHWTAELIVDRSIELRSIGEIVEDAELIDSPIDAGVRCIPARWFDLPTKDSILCWFAYSIEAGEPNRRCGCQNCQIEG